MSYGGHPDCSHRNGRADTGSADLVLDW